MSVSFNQNQLLSYQNCYRQLPWKFTCTASRKCQSKAPNASAHSRKMNCTLRRLLWIMLPNSIAAHLLRSNELNESSTDKCTATNHESNWCRSCFTVLIGIRKLHSLFKFSTAKLIESALNRTRLRTSNFDQGTCSDYTSLQRIKHRLNSFQCLHRNSA